MSYKYYKIKISDCENYDSLFLQICEIAYQFNCLGIEELNIDEEQVDLLLGDKAFVSGEIGADIIDTIDRKQNDFLIYYNCEQNTSEFEIFLANIFCEFQLFDNIVEKDWNSSWKESYKPIRIGNHLTIYPSWFEIDESITQKDYIYIYPGMGFGTGTHETTYLCLEVLYDITSYFSDFTNCLDLGCGSGILGIVIQKYFNYETTYCDVDSDALVNTKQNLEINNLSSDQLVLRKNLGNKSYNLVFANIILSELINEKKYIFESVKNEGVLILSGILNDQVDEIKKHYSDLKLICERKKNDWSCLAYVK